MSLGHQMNIAAHEKRFGMLGYPQNGTQKKALKEANRKLENELTSAQKASRDAAIKKETDGE